MLPKSPTPPKKLAKHDGHPLRSSPYWPAVPDEPPSKWPSNELQEGVVELADQHFSCELNQVYMPGEQIFFWGLGRCEMKGTSSPERTGILGRRTAPFPPSLISDRVPHGFTPNIWLAHGSRSAPRASLSFFL